MIKRFSCLLLTFVILLSLVAVGSISAFATEETAESEKGLTISDDCMAILKKEEGFSKKPYWDYTQYTVGYGTKCPEDMRAYYTANGITEEEAEVLLRNHLVKVEKDLNDFAKKYSLELTQNQFDAILLFSYNCGTGWCYDSSGTFHQAIAKGATGNDLVRAFALWCSAGGEIKDYLLRRRLSEANMYLNAVYSQTPPQEYCYVLYDANGGTTSPRSQGYSTQWEAAPYPVPTYTGYTFDGWYTAKTGGEKVTKLDASTKGKTLFAHWKDKDGNEKENNEPTVVVTVTATDVNMRKGPGTNYTSIGRQAQKGDKLTIVETATGNPSRWGRFTEYGGGWICLTYTNYETALKELENTQKPDNTEPTEPETTAPTEPEATEPETTEPAPTEPKPTEPAPTEPKPTEPEKEDPKPATPKLMGTVKVNEFLRIRKGPSTGYAEVGRLKPNDRVEILEKKTVGATVWGRIDKGWISLDYVKLDSTTSGGNASSGNTSSGSTSSSKTGKIVNCSEWVRIRSGAGTSYSIAGYYYPGDTITITEQKKVGSVTWAKTSKGWVSMDYVKITSTGSSSGATGGNTSSGNTSSGNTSSGNTSSSKTGKIVNCSEWVRIRSGAGTSYSVAGYYYPGDKVTITEQKTVGATKWGKTDKGWVSMDYVKLDSTSSGTTESSKTTMTIIADYLNIRNNPGTSGTTIVGYLTYGAKVEVLETKTVGGSQWGRIANGWICLDYAK